MVLSKGLTHISDSIEFKSLNTGGQSVGNGGDGNFSGKIVNTPIINFDPSNKAYGADVAVNTGDHVKQTADWQAGGANADAAWFAKAHGGTATSSGNQTSSSGHDTSHVYANTTAHQSNSLVADMHQDVMAGIGGNGGNGNAALGGDVSFHLDTHL